MGPRIEGLRPDVDRDLLVVVAHPQRRCVAAQGRARLEEIDRPVRVTEVGGGDPSHAAADDRESAVRSRRGVNWIPAHTTDCRLRGPRIAHSRELQLFAESHPEP